MKTIVVSLDTLRADRLGCLGNPRALTPNLDRLAAEGAVFTNAFANDIPTQPAHTSVFTGRFGIKSGIVSHFFPPASLEAEVPWLPSMIRATGRPTAAVDHLFVMKDWFIRGYTDYIVPPGRSRSPAREINDFAFPWIEEHLDDDFFLFLHYWDAHIPYVPPAPFHEQFAGHSASWHDPTAEWRIKSRPTYPLFKRNLYDFLDKIPNLDYICDLYDAEIAYLDFQLGQLRTKLEQLGILEDTTLVLFGDHGENMTEHDAWFDHAGLYDSVTHVPLIIWNPPTVAARRVEALVQLVDVFPTMCELVGIPVPQGTDGLSLTPLINAERATQYEAVMLSECTWQAKRAIRTAEWKYILCYEPGVYDRRGSELYHIPSDRDEQVDLVDSRPEVAAALDLVLRNWVERQLDGREDPFQHVIREGLPAIDRLRKVIEEDGFPDLTAATHQRGHAVHLPREKSVASR